MPRAANFYDFLDGQIENAEAFLDPIKREKTKLMKVVTVTRTPGGRLARLGFTLTRPKPRDIELIIDEATARAIVKVFDDAPAELGPDPEGEFVEGHPSC
jgi:hypothetical protein